MIVAVTRVRVRNMWVLPFFGWQTAAILREARAAAGNLLSTGRSTGLLSFWTMTAWEDPRALHAFLRAGAHGKAMRKARGWFEEASIVDWSADERPTDWGEARSRLQSSGRLVPVDHPSAAQAAGELLGSDARREV